MSKYCASCKKTLHEDRFGTNRHGNPLNTCRRCLADQKKERYGDQVLHKPVFSVPPELIEWCRQHARMPNHKGHLRTICAYTSAGIDDGIIVTGKAVERVVNPLFGHPMI